MWGCHVTKGNHQKLHVQNLGLSLRHWNPILLPQNCVRLPWGRLEVDQSFLGPQMTMAKLPYVGKSPNVVAFPYGQGTSPLKNVVFLVVSL